MSLSSFASFPKDRSASPPARAGGAWAGIFPARQVDQEAFSAQWTRVQLSLRSYLASLLHDRVAVDDCLQEIALLAWKKGPQDCEDRAFLAWCIECAKRVGATEIRRRSRSKLSVLPPDLVADLAAKVGEAELSDPQAPAARLFALGACLEKLTPSHRRLLEIRYALEKPDDLKKQAHLFGKSMAAIYKRLERLRAVLRECVVRKLNVPE